jgi:hypothetical protein
MTAQRGPYKSGKDFNAERTKRLTHVQEALEEYRAHLPLSARSIFYVLVGLGHLAKTEKAYARLIEDMTEARRAVHHKLHIPMDMIAGDDIAEDGGGGWAGHSSPSDYVTRELERLREDFSPDEYKRARLEGQQVDVIVWC